MEENIKEISAYEALQIAKRSYFLDKVIYKWIKNAATHNQTHLYLDATAYEKNKIEKVINELKDNKYTIIFNSELNEYDISWEEV